MSKPVAGPYKYDPEGMIILAEKDQMVVAVLRGWGYLTGAGGLGLDPADAVEVQDATGALLAAAPDLLQALRLMLERFGHTEWDSVHDLAALVDARAAIAKAERRQA